MRYITPEFEILKFETIDIICTSDTLTGDGYNEEGGNGNNQGSAGGSWT